jgi:ABC-2 type transport system permease protein
VLLLRRDPQTLVLLFAMPAAFILIMSLALQDRFSAAGKSPGVVLVADADGGPAAQRLIDAIGDSVAFQVERLRAIREVTERVAKGRGDFGVAIEGAFGRSLRVRDQHPNEHVRLVAAPDVDPRRGAMLSAIVGEALGQLRIEQLAKELRPMVEIDPQRFDTALRVDYLYGDDDGNQRPSSVQQNVPAWLVFGVFFVVMPLSSTMIRERHSGMERRLRTMPVGQGALVLAKLLPYLAVNQLQTLAMLAMGVYVVPTLGGQALSLDGVSAGALATMALAVSIAALGYGLVVASVARTTEQASMLGGGGNILLAAIGGIMVPEFVMPPTLQALTDVSPMAWALDGFLATFLDQDTWHAVVPRAAALMAFGFGGVAIAGWKQARRTG